jgi:hypothetical protein
MDTVPIFELSVRPMTRGACPLVPRGPCIRPTVACEDRPEEKEPDRGQEGQPHDQAKRGKKRGREDSVQRDSVWSTLRDPSGCLEVPEFLRMYGREVRPQVRLADLCAADYTRNEEAPVGLEICSPRLGRGRYQSEVRRKEAHYDDDKVPIWHANSKDRPRHKESQEQENPRTCRDGYDDSHSTREGSVLLLEDLGMEAPLVGAPLVEGHLCPTEAAKVGAGTGSADHRM